MHQSIDKHALRTLIKQGNKEALAILGYSSSPEINITNLKIKSTEFKIGQKLEFTFDVNSKSDQIQNLMIDYKIYFLKANGKNRPKVFKLSKKKIRPKEKINFSKSLEIKQLSTRKIYPGIHYLQIQINGNEYDKIEFTVTP